MIRDEGQERDDDMGSALWQRIATTAGLELTGRQLDQLGHYLDLLTAWNARVNLTRIVDRADAEVRHVADALTLLAFIGKANAASPLRLADVGTGGGVPGVPLAIARPDVRVTLIDATKKKLDAIAAMAAELGLTNVTTRHARIESITETFDVVTARAVADLDTLLGWCGPLLHRRGVLLAMKGPRAAEEIAAIDRKTRARWRIDVRPVDFDELAGHVVVEVRPNV
jgi:16S rRNA (guanine527-N7)-methyltransferase